MDMETDGLEKQVRMLETRRRQTTNELRMTREEYEDTSRNYYEIYSRMEEKVRDRTRELAESEQRYRFIFENVQDIYYESTTHGYLLEISPSVRDVLQYQREEMVSRYLTEICAVPERWAAFVEKLLDRDRVREYEIELIQKGGEIIPCSVNAVLVRTEAGQPAKIVGSIRDLLERKKAEAERLSKEKLESIVEMAGAICHEINQPLFAASGYAELVLMNLPENDPRGYQLRAIQDQVDRIAGITKKLMGITRYRTIEYVDGRKIIDIDRSSSG